MCIGKIYFVNLLENLSEYIEERINGGEKVWKMSYSYG